MTRTGRKADDDIALLAVRTDDTGRIIAAGEDAEAVVAVTRVLVG